MEEPTQDFDSQQIDTPESNKQQDPKKEGNKWIPMSLIGTVCTILAVVWFYNHPTWIGYLIGGLPGFAAIYLSNKALEYDIKPKLFDWIVNFLNGATIILGALGLTLMIDISFDQQITFSIICVLGFYILVFGFSYCTDWISKRIREYYGKKAETTKNVSIILYAATTLLLAASIAWFFTHWNYSGIMVAAGILIAAAFLWFITKNILEDNDTLLRVLLKIDVAVAILVALVAFFVPDLEDVMRAPEEWHEHWLISGVMLAVLILLPIITLLILPVNKFFRKFFPKKKANKAFESTDVSQWEAPAEQAHYVHPAPKRISPVRPAPSKKRGSFPTILYFILVPVGLIIQIFIFLVMYFAVSA